jgi:hypothetical protein
MEDRRRQVWLVLMGLAGASCDSVASNRYEGDVLATLQGVVSAGAQPPGVPLEVGLVWGQPDGKAIKLIAEKVPLTGQFPAEFTVQLHHPPPQEAGFQFPGGRINLAFIAALAKNDWKPGTRLTTGRNVTAYAVADEILVHLDRDMPPGQGVLGLGGVHTAGFHLIEQVLVGADEARREAEACHKQFPLAPAEACAAEPAEGGQFRVTREAKEGLGHRIRLALTFPDFTVLSGGDDDPGPPCDDCGDLINPTTPDGGTSDGHAGSMGEVGGAFDPGRP